MPANYVVVPAERNANAILKVVKDSPLGAALVLMGQGLRGKSYDDIEHSINIYTNNDFGYSHYGLLDDDEIHLIPPSLLVVGRLQSLSGMWTYFRDVPTATGIVMVGSLPYFRNQLANLFPWYVSYVGLPTATRPVLRAGYIELLKIITTSILPTRNVNEEEF